MWGIKPGGGVVPCPSWACSCELPLQPAGNTSRLNTTAAMNFTKVRLLKLSSEFLFFSILLYFFPSPNFSEHHISAFLKPCQLDGAPEQQGGTLISVCSTPWGQPGCLATPDSREHLANMTRRCKRERALLSTGPRTLSFIPALSEWHCYSHGVFFIFFL